MSAAKPGKLSLWEKAHVLEEKPFDPSATDLVTEAAGHPCHLPDSRWP